MVHAGDVTLGDSMKLLRIGTALVGLPPVPDAGDSRYDGR